MYVKSINQGQERKRFSSFKNVFRKKELSVWHKGENHFNNADALYEMAHGKFSFKGAFYPRTGDYLLEASKLYHAAAVDFIVSGHLQRAAEGFEKSAETLIEHLNNKAANVSGHPKSSGHELLLFEASRAVTAGAPRQIPYSADLHHAARDYLCASILYGEGHRRGRERSDASARRILLGFGFRETGIAKELSYMNAFVSKVATYGQ